MAHRLLVPDRPPPRGAPPCPTDLAADPADTVAVPLRRGARRPSTRSRRVRDARRSATPGAAFHCLRLLLRVRELSQKLGAKPGAHVVVYFTSSREELERRFEHLKATLDPADGLWIAWPKKASKLETDLDFDAVQRTGLEHGLVDNKSCSIDESWQALRFVYRLAHRPQL